MTEVLILIIDVFSFCLLHFLSAMSCVIVYFLCDFIDLTWGDFLLTILVRVLSVLSYVSLHEHLLIFFFY